MARIFISHSHTNNAEALALRDWLVAHGWDDLFLDIDPHRGLVSGERWLDRLQESARRCKAVLFVLSRGWLASRYCTAEFWEARKQERPLFAVVIDDTAVSEVPPEMRGVWQLVFLTRGSRFETFSVQPPPDYVQAEVQFSQEGLQSLRLGLAQAGLTSFDTESFPWPAPGFEREADGLTPRRPYRGLKPVDVPDAGVFFGRDADLVRARDLLTELRERGGRCLFVILGASGAGKSSFLRAGLMPRLFRDDRRFLPLPVLRPRGAAMWGEEGLLVVLEAAYRRAGLAATRAGLRKDLEEGGAGFLHRLADLRSVAAKGVENGGKPPTLVLSIDQAEELLITLHGDHPGEAGAAEAGLFLSRLAEILRYGPETLALVTIRSDEYELWQTAETLAGLQQVLFNLPLLAATAYRSVIEGPAARATDAGRSLILEPKLIDTLLNDAQGADALPLLGFTLERLYVEHGSDGALALADYEALGGVQSSIEAAVAEAFVDPDSVPRIPAGVAEREALLKRAFVPHLMGVNEASGEPVRRTARLADLPVATHGLIGRLIDRRLLVVDRRALAGGTDEAVVEIAHEALLRRWPTLRRWHDQERAALEIQQEIVRAAAAWNQSLRVTDWLVHRGSRLTEAEMVARREDFTAVFTGVPGAYLRACRQAADAARDTEALRLARQRALQRKMSVSLAIVALVTLAGGALVMASQRKIARQESRLLSVNAKEALEAGQYDRAMRMALAASQGSWFAPSSVNAEIQLGRAAYFSRLEVQLAGGLRSAAFSADGTHLFTSTGYSAQVWSPDEDGDWSYTTTPEGGYRTLRTVAFTRDGSRIFTSTVDGANLWDRDHTGTWHSTAELDHPVDSADFSPDGRQLVLASGGTAFLWERRADGGWSREVLSGQEDKVASAFFSPDADRIVTLPSDSGAVRVRNRQRDGTWHSDLLVHREKVTQASFSPDGTCLLTLTHDGTASVWSRERARGWHSTALREQKVISASLSRDAGHVVTISWDGTAKVWNKSEQGPWESFVLQDPEGRTTAVAFSPSGSRVVTGSSKGALRIWRENDRGGWSRFDLRGYEDAVNSVRFSPDGNRFFTLSEGVVWVWDLRQEGLPPSLPLAGLASVVTSAAFSPDGARIVTGLADGTVQMWHRGKNGPWRSLSLKGHRKKVTSASFSSDGRRFLTSSTDGTVRLWSPSSADAWQSQPVKVSRSREIDHASFSPDGSLLLIQARQPRDGYAFYGDVELLREGKKGEWSSVALDSQVEWARFSPDGAYILTYDGGLKAKIWTSSPIGSWHSTTFDGYFLDSGMSFSPDGGQLVIYNGYGAKVWRIGFWQRHGLWGFPSDWTELIGIERVGSASFSPDGTRIVTGSQDGTVGLWSRDESGEWTNVAFQGHRSAVNVVAFSPDGAHILTASDDTTARVWDVRWLMGPHDWARTEALSLPETVCREKLRSFQEHYGWMMSKRQGAGPPYQLRELNDGDVDAAFILNDRRWEDVCAPFLEP